MPFTQFTNLDFDQIKAQIKDFLRANSNFTDFDFEGSNFSVIIDTLAYNTYINAFNANLVANESFLDSATIRENVVSLARNIGYIPRSKSAAQAKIKLGDVLLGDSSSDNIPKFITLRPGLVCVGNSENTTFTFSIPDSVTSSRIVNKKVGETTDGQGNTVDVLNSFAQFDDDITILEGVYLTSTFVVSDNIDERFIIGATNIDTSTLRVSVRSEDGTSTNVFKQVDNILKIDKNSEIYLTQEVQDNKIELIFGDGIFGKKLEMGSTVTASYIVSNGKDGNGPRNFNFQGTFSKPSTNTEEQIFVPLENVTITTVRKAQNGDEPENISSIKYLAPRLYSAQYRAVTPRDYEAIIKDIFPRTESVSVIGGEELDPPQFGKVQISIKPLNGTFVSDFDKSQIKSKLKQYAIAGINNEIVDLKILYVEIESNVYYNPAQVNSIDGLKTTIKNSLEQYANNVEINRFGGRFKYSKINQLIDRTSDAITSNITKVTIRRDLKATLNSFAQYELCFGNRFYINPAGFNIKSTGFTINGFNDTCFLTDVPNKNTAGNLDGSMKGTMSVVSRNSSGKTVIIAKNAGGVDYMKGEVLLNTINITSTVSENNIIEVQAFPESNDVVGLKDLFLSFDVSNTTINMVKDVIASGEDISGIRFTRDFFTSSYSNGTLERK